MVLWFAGLSWVAVWLVFNDTAMDYRLVMAGALLPDLIDAPFGGARLAHTLLFSVALLGAVMIVTRGRRRARRTLLALPIGTFMHLVLDAMWTRTRLFWWPAFGWSFGAGGLPSLDRPATVLVAQELAGLAALVWCWRAFGLAERTRFDRFCRSGRLDPDLGGPGRRSRR